MLLFNYFQNLKKEVHLILPSFLNLIFLVKN